MSILSTGISALNAFQRQLATTGHNIANVNTEGYSKQSVDFAALEPDIAGGAGYLGRGVEAASIQRSYDNYLAGRARAYNSSQAEFEIYHDRSSQVDNVLADAAAGLDGIMQGFFDAVHDVSADPTSIPARNVMLNRSDMLVDRFQSLAGWFDDLRFQVNRDLEIFTDEINNIGSSIADINARIQSLNSSAVNPPNDLLDERDKLVDELSRYVTVTTLDQDDGSLNVAIGNGQALVVGATYSQLNVINNPLATDHKEISITLAGGYQSIITNQISGGEIGGLLRFRNEVLDPAQNSLGLVALGLAQNFNDEHITGMDLGGDLGGAYFNMAAPDVLGHPANSGTIAVGFNNLADVSNQEYELSYDGADWSITNLELGTTTVLGPAGPFVHDGLDITIGAGAAAGDLYRIRPARLGASLIDTLVADPRDIAAAEAVRTADLASNTGTGHIGAGTQVSSTGTSLLALPVTLTFNAGTNELTSPLGNIPYDPATDSGSTLTLTIPGLGDYSFEMTGTPANLDQFTLSSNAGGVGDGRNAVRLASLQNAQLLFGNTASLSDAYAYMVADVGTQTHQSGANSAVHEQLLNQAENAKLAVSGVNLDEEAADLVRFQQAYSAAAQVISTANTLFDTLLGAVRR